MVFCVKSLSYLETKGLFSLNYKNIENTAAGSSHVISLREYSMTGYLRFILELDYELTTDTVDLTYSSSYKILT